MLIFMISILWLYSHSIFIIYVFNTEEKVDTVKMISDDNKKCL